MKRLGFIAALFGVGKAAAQTSTTVTPDSFTGEVGCGNPTPGGGCTIVNNQCPVCGTMAAPYRPTVEEFERLYPCAATSTGPTFNTGCRGWSKEDLPKSNQVRCARCNAAFWQDAE